ncbi:MAG: serine/threonine protein kinase [Opitutus sp.]|nr:serine/threonine protein kinase [Opitutus sp.]
MVALVVLTSMVSHLRAAPMAADWPGWRGPTRDGQAAAGQTPPQKWSETENVVWRALLPGKGHSSPTIAGNRIYLATADAAAEEQRVLGLDQATGKIVWNTVVHRGKVDETGERNSSPASCTVACDGERLYINFFNDHAVHTSALDLDGKVLWQQRVSSFVTIRGFGSSPVVHDSVVLVSADHKAGGKLAGLDKRTGKIVWQHDRPALQNYSSPALLVLAGRPQMIVAGCNLVASFEPSTGTKLWEVAGSTETTVTTPVTDGRRIFITGGFPKSHVAAIEGDGSGQLVWQSGAGIYVPSLLVHDGYVYAVLDTGKAVCWKADTGDELWREKVDRDFFASPVMAGNRIYATNVAGVTSVFEASPQRFTLLAQNLLGDEAYASPAIAGNRLYLRHAKKGEPRQEYLWCIGQ